MEDLSAPADIAAFPDVVATVNGTDISKTELIERADAIRTQIPPTEDTASEAFYGKVLDDVIGSELLFQASTDAGLLAEPGEVDSQIAMFKGRFPDPATFEQALAQQGMTAESLEDRIARDLSVQKFVEEQINQKVSVAPEQVREFYDGNADEMRQPDQLRLSHILKRVAADATPEVKAETRRVMETLLEQARAGGDFAALAQEHSEDPGSQANGGELTVSRGETVPPFEQAAFALEPGGVSDVVETQFGFHIIKVAERIDGQAVPFEEAKPRIEMFLKQQALQEAVGTKVDSLRESASVEVFI